MKPPRWLREHWPLIGGSILVAAGTSIVVSALISGAVRQFRRSVAGEIFRDQDPQGFYLTLLGWIVITLFFSAIMISILFQDMRIRRALKRRSDYAPEQKIIGADESVDKASPDHFR